MNFGEALQCLKEGKRVARSGWNGKGMFAYLVPAASYPVQTGAAKAHFGDDVMVPYRAYLALKTADDDVATWAPSCSDVLADDWTEIGSEHTGQVPAHEPTFLERLKIERDELDERVTKLTQFLGAGASGATPTHKEMLGRQLIAMSEYLVVLDERLTDLGIAARSAPVEEIPIGEDDGA